MNFTKLSAVLEWQWHSSVEHDQDKSDFFSDVYIIPDFVELRDFVDSLLVSLLMPYVGSSKPFISVLKVQRLQNDFLLNLVTDLAAYLGT